MVDIHETEIDLSNIPPEYFTENGELIKTEVAKKLGAFNNSQIDDTIYFFDNLTKAEENTYYRLEQLGTSFGIVYRYTSGNIQLLFRDILEAIFSAVTSIVACGWANEQKSGIEIWGLNKEGEGVILYFYPYDIGVTEI